MIGFYTAMLIILIVTYGALSDWRVELTIGMVALVMILLAIAVMVAPLPN